MVKLYEQGKAAGESIIGLDYIDTLKKEPVNRLQDRFWLELTSLTVHNFSEVRNSFFFLIFIKSILYIG